MAFPVLAVIAIGVAIFEATEKLKKHNEEMVKTNQESLTVADSIGKHAEQLRIQNLRLQDEIAILQKRVP